MESHGHTEDSSTDSSAHSRLLRNLSAFKQDILFILGEEARYGLAIKRALEERYGTDVNHGRLYPNLDDLVDAGLVAKTPLDKRTNQYALTDRGRRFVEMAAAERADRLGYQLVDGDHRLADAEPVTDGGQTPACPECNTRTVRRRRPEHINSCAENDRWKCDHCGAAFDEPAFRPPATGSARDSRHGLAKRLDDAEPDDIRADGGENIEIEPPNVSVGDRVTLCERHDGDAEYVEGIVATVHSPRTIDVVYRVESRAANDGDGSFERDHHTDRYEFTTSAVYMADVNGWLKGWDDA